MSVLTLDSVPSPVPADFDLSFVDADGGRRCEPLSACWSVPFERALPVRAFSSYRGKKSFSGLWWSSNDLGPRRLRVVAGARPRHGPGL